MQGLKGQLLFHRNEHISAATQNLYIRREGGTTCRWISTGNWEIKTAFDLVSMMQQKKFRTNLDELNIMKSKSSESKMTKNGFVHECWTAKRNYIKCTNRKFTFQNSYMKTIFYKIISQIDYSLSIISINLYFSSLVLF
jgi:hypothetical protein